MTPLSRRRCSVMGAAAAQRNNNNSKSSYQNVCTAAARYILWSELFLLFNSVEFNQPYCAAKANYSSAIRLFLCQHLFGIFKEEEEFFFYIMQVWIILREAVFSFRKRSGCCCLWLGGPTNILFVMANHREEERSPAGHHGRPAEKRKYVMQ